MNPRIYILAVVLLLLLLVLGEMSHQKYYSKPLHCTELPFHPNFLKGHFDRQFGNYIIRKDTSYVMAFMDDKENINFYNLSAGRTESSIDFSKYVNGLQFYSVRFIDNRLYLLDIDHKSLLIFRISNEKSSCLDTIYRLDNIVDWKKYYVRCQAGNVFEVRANHLFLAYGIFNRGSCLDTTAYLEIDLSKPAGNLLVKKAFRYPDEYYRNHHYKTDTWLCFDDSNTKYVGFRNNNTIYRVGEAENDYNMMCFEEQSVFRVFNWDRVNELSYIRWFVLTDECNVNALVLNDNKLLIIKRLTRNEIADGCEYEYYVLDKNLDTIIHNSFQQPIHPSFCYPYKNGFLVFDENLDKTWYYEAY